MTACSRDIDGSLIETSLSSDRPIVTFGLCGSVYAPYAVSPTATSTPPPCTGFACIQFGSDCTDRFNADDVCAARIPKFAQIAEARGLPMYAAGGHPCVFSPSLVSSRSLP